MFASLENPGVQLAADKADVVAETRTRLFARLDAIGLGLSSEVAAVLEARERRDSGPPLGEVWPWILADIADIPLERVRPVADAWLALHVYSAISDEKSDEVGGPTADAMMAASMLFEIGLGDLYQLTSRTPWFGLVRSSIQGAARAQSQDVIGRHAQVSIEARRAVAADKNSGFVAGAAAFAGIPKFDPGPLVRFAQRILLALQHLDDVGDLSSDAAIGNRTPILQLAYGSGTWNTGRAKDKDSILEQVIASGALHSVLEEARSALVAAYVQVAAAYPHANGEDTRRFFATLRSQLGALCDLLPIARVELAARHTSLERRRIVVGDVQRRITIVAQQS